MAIKFATITIEYEIELRALMPRCHLFLKHQPGALLMLENLLLKLLNLEIPLINMISHLLYVEPSLILIPL